MKLFLLWIDFKHTTFSVPISLEWTCRNRTTRPTQDSQFWVVHNHIFASCLPRNQEKQPPKMDHSSPRQCELSHIGLNNCIFEHSIHRLEDYSPDLAPNDFFLFPYVKNKIRGQHFSTPEEAVDVFRMHVLEIPQSGWQKSFDNWFKRMQKCINFNGKYYRLLIFVFVL